MTKQFNFYNIRWSKYKFHCKKRFQICPPANRPKNLSLNNYLFIDSVVDPNTLNLDPDPGFGPIWIRIQGFSSNFKTIPTVRTKCHKKMFSQLSLRILKLNLKPLDPFYYMQYLYVWIWIRICIPNTNPDPQSSWIRIQYGSRSTTLVRGMAQWTLLLVMVHCVEDTCGVEDSNWEQLLPVSDSPTIEPPLFLFVC